MRKFLIWLRFILIVCMAILISGCANQAEVDQSSVEKSVNEALSHSELVQSYAEMKDISEKEAEAEIAVMHFPALQSDFEQYRMVSLPVEKDENRYILRFILISDKKNDNWQIKSIESAWIENLADEKQTFLGTISFWIRDKRKIEYVANGDFYNAAGISVEFQKESHEEAETINLTPIGGNTLKSLGYLELHETVKI